MEHTKTASQEETLAAVQTTAEQTPTPEPTPGQPLPAGAPSTTDAISSDTPSDSASTKNTTAVTASVTAEHTTSETTRPPMPNRQSSGTMIVPRDSIEALRPVDTGRDAGDMSPRRTDEDLAELGRQTRDEVQRNAKLLQDSLLLIFHRIQAVQEEHDKLDNNNKFLQKYIGDLMSTSKITATSSSRGKK